MSQIVENALSRNVEKSFKKFLHPDTEEDAISTDRPTSLVKFS